MTKTQGWTTSALPIKFHFDHNIGELREMYSYFLGKGFLVDAGNEFGRGGNRSFLKKMIRQIITEEIYNKWSNEDRTGRLLDSFQVRFSAEELTMIAYSDPAIAPSKGPFHSGGNPAEFSYAAFFEKPAEFNSFIPKLNGDVHHQVRYRPFFTPMVRVIHVLTTRNAVDALVKVIRAKLPKGKGKKV